jgi:hypothetical protein
VTGARWRWRTLHGAAEQDRAQLVRDAFCIRIGVLNDERRDALRVPGRKAKADGATEVLQIESVALEADALGEGLQHIGEMIEGVRKRVDARASAVAKAGIVRRNEVIAIGQPRDQIAKHMRGSREAVQEEDGRRIARAGLSIEDLEARSLDRPVVRRYRVMVGHLGTSMPSRPGVVEGGPATFHRLAQVSGERRIAHEGADLIAALGEASGESASDLSGRSGDEDPRDGIHPARASWAPPEPLLEGPCSVHGERG